MFFSRFGGLEEKKCSRVRRREEKVEKEEDKSCRSKMLESEETDKTVSMMLEEEDNGNNGNTMLEPEEGNLRLGPETAFLAEGSVHDTGGMVEWAGTVKNQIWNYQIIYYNK